MMQRDSKSAEFFEAAKRDELVIKRCRCGRALAPETAVCTSCGRNDLGWETAAGTGELVTWTVVHKPPNAAFADLVPYTVGIVELTEGPWLYARIDHENPLAGLALTATFVHPDAGESYPGFV